MIHNKENKYNDEKNNQSIHKERLHDSCIRAASIMLSGMPNGRQNVKGSTRDGFLSLLLVKHDTDHMFTPHEFCKDYYLYPWCIDLFKMISSGEPWVDNPIFPRKAICDGERLRLANNHNFLIECNLNFNPLNEKLFLLCWFALLVLLVLAIFNLFHFALNVCNRNLTKWLKMHLPVEAEKLSHCQFLLYLGQNGQDLIQVFLDATTAPIGAQLIVAILVITQHLLLCCQ